MFEPLQPSLVFVSIDIEAPTNIRRGYKAPPSTNAVAYFCIGSVLIKKRFYNTSGCHPENFDNGTSEVCDNHVYNTEHSSTNYGLSIVADLDLATCEGSDWPLMVLP